jgi:hypothetical protein
MTDITVTADIQQLLDQWAEAERDGVEYPVPYDMAWPMAGYSRVDSAKRYLPKSARAGLYHVTRIGSKGRPAEKIMLSLDGFKHLCLMADTPEGEAIRDYFIESDKKWKLVEQTAPKLAEEIEILQLKAEISKQEAIARRAEQETLTLRHYVVTSLPEPVQQKILGFKEVKTVEYRDRILDGEALIRDGSTLNKTALCQRYGLVTKKGGADYPRLNAVLKQLPSEAFKLTAIVRENEELNIDYLPDLDRLFLGNTRQLGLGE